MKPLPCISRYGYLCFSLDRLCGIRCPHTSSPLTILSPPDLSTRPTDSLPDFFAQYAQGPYTDFYLDRQADNQSFQDFDVDGEGGAVGVVLQRCFRYTWGFRRLSDERMDWCEERGLLCAWECGVRGEVEKSLLGSEGCTRM